MAEKKSSEKKEKHTHLIRLRNVAKYYQMGEEIVRAVDGINIEVRPGEFVAIMGPSGSGKSTTMNLVGSLDLATQGDIFLDGLDIEELHESDLAQVRGMMFQDIDSEVREARAEQLLKMVGLEERMDHHPNQLSGGEQQRVAIARSLANNPEIILADEPTGNLDTKTGEIVLHYLDKLNKEGKTIIMVTHDPRLAEEHAQVIFHIKDGKLEKVTKKIKGRWVVIDRGTHN
ncbi:MAG: ABC transporter ATP-binding protein [archaeon]|nr:ABC transporter ATP-binding protein [archaeon]